MAELPEQKNKRWGTRTGRPFCCWGERTEEPGNGEGGGGASGSDAEQHVGQPAVACRGPRAPVVCNHALHVKAPVEARIFNHAEAPIPINHVETLIIINHVEAPIIINHVEAPINHHRLHEASTEEQQRQLQALTVQWRKTWRKVAHEPPCR